MPATKKMPPKKAGYPGRWKVLGLQKLNMRHELFCVTYIAQGLKHAPKAYVAAGFSAGGAHQSAWQLMQDPLIKARIAELMNERFKKLHMEVDELLARTAMLARADVRGLYDENGKLLAPSDLDMETAVGVASVKVYEEFSGTGKDRVKVGETKEVRLRDPMPAIRLLAEHKKLVKVPDTGVNALANALASRLRAAREHKRKKES
jgi:phage terminase small subunit